MNKPTSQIKVDIDPQVIEGTYSNLAFCHLSPSEFILDFARLMPGPPQAKVHSRIILTPQAAKAVTRLLQDNLKRFEEQHGEIKMAGGDNAAPIGFAAADVPPKSQPSS
jgi:hypothetical protein